MSSVAHEELVNTVVIPLRQFRSRHPLKIKADKNENFRICLLRDCIL